MAMRCIQITYALYGITRAHGPRCVMQCARRTMCVQPIFTFGMLCVYHDDNNNNNINNEMFEEAWKRDENSVNWAEFICVCALCAPSPISNDFTSSKDVLLSIAFLIHFCSLSLARVFIHWMRFLYFYLWNTVYTEYLQDMKHLWYDSIWLDCRLCNHQIENRNVKLRLCSGSVGRTETEKRRDNE